jgi:cell division protein FtsA
MTNKKNHSLIAALDIGSTKVAVVIGSLNSEQRLDARPDQKNENQIEIIGVGTAPNTGIRQGVVVNIEATTEAIRKAREDAELMAGYPITEVWVGVSGAHIKSFDSKGMVAIKNKEVTNLDVERVIDAAKAVAVPTDRQVLHVLPREYKVDGQDGILDPVGMSGIRLEAAVHIVTASHASLANNIKCIEKAGLKIQGLVLDQLASANAVLSEDEKALGVAVADMGGGTCNLIYFINGSVAHTSVIPVGGSHFTHDVAIGLRTPQMAAEDLKKKFGCAMATLVSGEETIEVEGVGGRKSRTVLRRDLAEVIEPRAEETLALIANDIRTSGLAPLLGSGLVLTGGASQLEGLIEMGEYIFDLPVRRGYPGKVGGISEVVKSPAYANAVGLLMHGLKIVNRNAHLHQRKATGEDFIGDSLNGIGNKVKSFFSDFFN